MSKTFGAVPQNLDDQESLRRFLSRVIEQIDIAFGNTEEASSATVADVTDTSTTSIANQEVEDVVSLTSLQNEITALTVRVKDLEDA